MRGADGDGRGVGERDRERDIGDEGIKGGGSVRKRYGRERMRVRGEGEKERRGERGGEIRSTEKGLCRGVNGEGMS